VARFYADENFPLPVVEALRTHGHDVLTAFEAGNANAAVPDVAVLEFATAHDRVLLSLSAYLKKRAAGAES
jgi:predicted nuclease of predicted toxin-antitoxin system